MEAKTYLKAEVMSDRLDYMNTTGNNLAYCLAVEKLVDLDVPERANTISPKLTEEVRSAFAEIQENATIRAVCQFKLTFAPA